MRTCLVRFVIATCLLAATGFAQQSSPAVSPAGTPSPTATPVISPSPAPAATAEDLSVVQAKKVLSQMIAAMGGAKFLTYNTMSLEGRSGGFYNGRPTGQDTEFWGFFQYPDKDRVELTPERDVIELYNGDKGWEMTYKGAHDFTPDELAPVLAARPYRLENILRVWLKDPGTALFYEGSDLVDDEPVDKVTLITNKNQSVTLMVDSNTHLLAKKLYVLRDEHGYRDEDADVYGNYHLVEGIQTPYTIMHIHNGDIQKERFLRSVTYNAIFPANFFTPEGVTIGKKKKK